jgi:tetratricopeptide (TPR) repeat protein
MLDGDSAVSIDVESSRPVARGSDEWPYLLEGADDAYELNDASEQQVIYELDLAWRKDRALHLALIFLDNDAELKTRKESVVVLEEFVADEKVLTHVLNRLHVAPMPVTADLAGAVRLAAKGYPRVNKALGEISKGQEAIALSRHAWELLPTNLFGSSRAKESFGFQAVGRGLFAAMSSHAEIDLSAFSHEDAEVIRCWRREIKSLASSLEARRANPRNADNIAVDFCPGSKKRVTYRTIAIAAAACVIVAVVLEALISTRPVKANSLVRLGTSGPGYQVVQSPLSGLQRELYGRTLVPYPLRSESKKTAERLFVSAEVEAREGRLENAAIAFRESNASSPTVAAKLNEAVALLNTSNLGQAERLLKSTLPDAEESDSMLLRAAVLGNLGQIYRAQGRFDDADRAYLRALEIDRNSKFKAGEAANLNNLALVLFGRGKLVKALVGFKKALSIAEEAGADSVAADTHLNMALILSNFGRRGEAEENFRLAAAYYNGQDSPLGQANYDLAFGQHIFQFVIAAAFYGKVAPREIDQALFYYNHARGLYRSMSNKSGEALALMEMGQAFRAKGDLKEALDQYSEASMLTEEIGDLPGQAVAFYQIGAWYYQVKAYDSALLNIKHSRDIARRIGSYGVECTALEDLSLIMAVTGQSDLALEYINDAVKVSLISGDVFVQAYAYDDLGFLLYKSFHRNDEAIGALERAYRLYSDVESPFRDQTRGLIDHVKKNTPPEQLMRDRFP